jgi:hypothetical protein
VDCCSLQAKHLAETEIEMVTAAASDYVALMGMGWASKTDPEETEYLKHGKKLGRHSLHSEYSTRSEEI